MIHIALYEPEIPPNTGNIMRLAANTGCQLHLIHPLGFKLDEKKLRRAGMDYRDLANVHEHKNYNSLMDTLTIETVYALTTKGSTPYHHVNFTNNCLLVFGPETRGLPDSLLKSLSSKQRIRVPMHPNSRSINLANTVSIVVYEALRQHNFPLMV